jgi:Domain of unknown function (DUF1906)
MTITGTVQSAPAGARGFDINTTVTAGAARQFVQAGYRYCIRYVPFGAVEDPDLTAAEAQTILSAGLGLMPVQHVRYPGWLPTGALGIQYGLRAVQYLQGIGFPGGVNVWCDLECVGTEASAEDVIDYCNNWYSTVTAGGYVPGLYVGYDSGMSDQQLYDLRFQHYWAAYNTNSSVPTRGYQLVQSPKSTDVEGLRYDDDVTQTDHLGGQALWLAAT